MSGQFPVIKPTLPTARPSTAAAMHIDIPRNIITPSTTGGGVRPKSPAFTPTPKQPSRGTGTA